MSQVTEENVIEFDVVLKARVEDPGDIPEPGPSGATGSSEQDGEDAAVEKDVALARFEDFVKDLDSQGLKNLKSMTVNPGATVEKKLLGMLGKAGIYGAIAAAIIALVLEAPDLVITIVKALGVKGGPLNQDYTRQLDNDMQLGIDKDLQFRRALGLDIVITSQDTKYIITDPGFVDNSLVDIETTRSNRIDSNETQYGYSGGL